MTSKDCENCGLPLPEVALERGWWLHPGCWCDHGETRGRRYCALCRYRDGDADLVERMNRQRAFVGSWRQNT